MHKLIEYGPQKVDHGLSIYREHDKINPKEPKGDSSHVTREVYAAAENNLNPNMVHNWKAEFLEHASGIFDEHSKAEREAKRKEAAAAKERDKMLKTIGQLTVERNFLQDCFRAVGKPIPEFDPEKLR